MEQQNNGDEIERVAEPLEQLALLQELDQRLQTKRLSCDLLRHETERKEQELAQKRQLVESLRTQRAELESRRQELEAALDAEESKMKERRMRLNRVRTEKELAATRREIEIGKETLQKLETDLLVCMEELENLAQQLSDAEAALAALERPTAELISSNREKLAALEAELARDRERRERLATRTDAGLRAKYEQISARRGGLAVVAVRDGTCLGCHMHVPPQLFNELQRGGAVHLCPNCHRMLIWRPDSQEAEGEKGKPDLESREK